MPTASRLTPPAAGSTAPPISEAAPGSASRPTASSFGSNTATDVFTVRANLAGNSMTLQGNDGADTFNLGFLPDPVKDAAIVAQVNDGQLNLLPGVLTIDAGLGSDRIHVN